MCRSYCGSLNSCGNPPRLLDITNRLWDLATPNTFDLKEII